MSLLCKLLFAGVLLLKARSILAGMENSQNICLQKLTIGTWKSEQVKNETILYKE